MSDPSKFKAVYASGMVIPSPRTVTALSLLFEKVFLPSNIESIKAFAQRYRLEIANYEPAPLHITCNGVEADPFTDLTPEQKETAHRYLEWSVQFAMQNASLYGPVFETNAFETGDPLQVTLIRQGAPGELNTYNVSVRPLIATSNEPELFADLIEKGYVPVVGQFSSRPVEKGQLDRRTTQELASLLAMKSVEMLLPRTQAARPTTILEARERLRDHLPPFWSAMYKLSVRLRELLKDSQSDDSVLTEARDLVDSTVRPALIDLKHKLELERKQWFYRILSPVQKGLRLMIGNPPLTQQQLISNALVLASDVTMSAADNLRVIDALKQETGLTYLLELDKLVEDPSA